MALVMPRRSCVLPRCSTREKASRWLIMFKRETFTYTTFNKLQTCKSVTFTLLLDASSATSAPNLTTRASFSPISIPLFATCVCSMASAPLKAARSRTLPKFSTATSRSLPSVDLSLALPPPAASIGLRLQSIQRHPQAWHLCQQNLLRVHTTRTTPS